MCIVTKDPNVSRFIQAVWITLNKSANSIFNNVLPCVWNVFRRADMINVLWEKYLAIKSELIIFLP